MIKNDQYLPVLLGHIPSRHSRPFDLSKRQVHAARIRRRGKKSLPGIPAAPTNTLQGKLCSFSILLNLCGSAWIEYSWNAAPWTSLSVAIMKDKHSLSTHGSSHRGGRLPERRRFRNEGRRRHRNPRSWKVTTCHVPRGMEETGKCLRLSQLEGWLSTTSPRSASRSYGRQGSLTTYDLMDASLMRPLM